MMGKQIAYRVLIFLLCIFGAGGWLMFAIGQNNTPKQEVKQPKGDTFSGAPQSVKALFTDNQTLAEGVTAEDLNKASKRYADNMAVQTLVTRGHRELLYTARLNASKVLSSKQELSDFQKFITNMKQQDLNYYLHNQSTLDKVEAQGKTNVYYVNKVATIVNGQITGDKLKKSDLEKLADHINKKVSYSLRDALVNQLALVTDDIKQHNNVSNSQKSLASAQEEADESSAVNRTTRTSSKNTNSSYVTPRKPVRPGTSGNTSTKDKTTNTDDDSNTDTDDTDSKDTSTDDTGTKDDGDYDVDVE